LHCRSDISQEDISQEDISQEAPHPSPDNYVHTARGQSRAARYAAVALEDDTEPELLLSHGLNNDPQGQDRGQYLGAEAFAFAKIPLNEFQSCRRFIEQNPSILSENYNLFLNEAIHALVEKENVLATSCIQGGLLIQECKSFSTTGACAYVNDLINNRKGALKSFYEKRDRLYAASKDKADQQRQADSAKSDTTLGGDRHRNTSSGQGYTTSSGQGYTTSSRQVYPTSGGQGYPTSSRQGYTTSSRQGYTTSSRQGYMNTAPNTLSTADYGAGGQFSPHLNTNTQASGRHGTTPNTATSFGRRGSDNLTTAMENMNVTGRHNPPPSGQQPSGQKQTHRHGSSGGRRGNSLASVEENPSRPGRFGKNWTLGEEAPDVKATDGDTETLDPRYKKRRDAKEFFTVGRVFAMLWHDNAGDPRGPGQGLGEPVYTSIGRYNEKIYSHIRRMVVVREKHGYSLCIPINTYGRRGLAAKKFNQEDFEDHAIVYGSQFDAPEALEGEGQMTKDPIAVDLAPGQELADTSRLNFGKPQSVDWNVKVMNVGKVSKRSMPFLEGYWENEARKGL